LKSRDFLNSLLDSLNFFTNSIFVDYSFGQYSGEKSYLIKKKQRKKMSIHALDIQIFRLILLL